MNRTAPTTLAAVLTAAGATLISGCTSFGVAREPITPQRPTISNDTKTTAFGTFEEELGVRLDPSDEYALSTRTSIGLSPQSELFLVWDPLVRLDSGQVQRDVDGDGSDETGVGDVIVGFKQRLLEEGNYLPATAIQIATSLPLGSDDGEISSGQIDWFGALIADYTFGRLGLTGFYELGLLSPLQPDPNTQGVGDLDSQHTLAIDGNWAIDEKLTAGAEFAAILRGEIDDEPLLLTLYSQYKLNPSMNIDAGVRFGLSEDADDVLFVVGLTTNLGRFF